MAERSDGKDCRRLGDATLRSIGESRARTPPEYRNSST